MMESTIKHTDSKDKQALLHAVIIVPPIQDFYFTPHRFSSIGSKIIEDLLLKKGIEVTLLNFPIMMKNGCTVSFPEELSYLKPFVLENESGKASFFKNLKRFGPSLEQCSEIICTLKPDFCFFSCFAFCYATPALQLAELVKQNFDNITIFGGAGVSTYPDYFLRCKSVDYTLSGEAEVNISKFVDYLTFPDLEPVAIPGVGWKKDGTVHYSSIKKLTTTDEIHCPVIKTFESNTTVYLTVSLSRGCPLECNFCSNWLCHGKEFRRCNLIQVNNIVEQIAELHICDQKVINLNFEDDNLLFDYPFWIQTIKTIKNHFPNSRFYAENGIDYRLLDIEKCRELISLGFSQFNFSLGSVNESIMKTAGRQWKLEHYTAMLAVASQFSIPVITYFICGFKEDTLESVAQNLAFLFEQETLIGISLFYPVPGIYGYEDRTIFDKKSPALCCGSSAFPWNNSLSTKTLVTAFRLARVINLSKSPKMSSTEKLLLNKIFESKKLFTLQKNKSGEVITEVPNQDYQLVDIFFKLIKL